MKTKLIASIAFLSSYFTTIFIYIIGNYGVSVFALTTALFFLLITVHLLSKSSAKNVAPRHKIGDVVSGDLSIHGSMVRIHESEYDRQTSEYICVYIASDEEYNYIIVCHDGVETIGSVSKKQ